MVKNLVLGLVIAAVLLTVFYNFSAQQKTQPMNYSQFIELVQSGQVRQVVIDGLRVAREEGARHGHTHKGLGNILSSPSELP